MSIALQGEYMRLADRHHHGIPVHAQKELVMAWHV